MKKVSFVKLAALSAVLVTGAAFAGAPANMVIANTTSLTSYAYLHDARSPDVLHPNSVVTIPWVSVKNMCHNTQATKTNDPCAFEVYATSGNNPEQYDVATVTFYVNSGKLASIVPHSNAANLKVVPRGLAKFALK